MIVGLVSTFQEGRLAEDAVRSLLPCCQVVLVNEGPITDARDVTIDRSGWTWARKEPRVTVAFGSYESDAEKRTALLTRSRRYPTPTWGVILDGDELLLHGEQIPALIEHHEQQAALAGSEPLRVPLRLVDGDGTVSVMTGRILRLDLVERWLISSYHILLRNGVEVSLANGKLVDVGVPDSRDLDVSTGFQLRRPLQGEPHILHRPFLRDPDRQAERQSSAEGNEFERLVRSAGLGSAHGETAKDERSSLWLPS